MNRIAVAVIGIVLTAGACGGAAGDSAKRQADGAAPGPDAGGDGSGGPSSPSGAPGGDAAAGATPGPGGAGDPGAAGSPSTTVAPGDDPKPATIPLAVEFVTACVRPGTTQTIVLRSEPNTDVGYDATYSDGKTGWASDHHGGSNKGLTGPTGEFRDTFLVKLSAPPGVVKVGAIAGNGRGYAHTSAEFTVADATGTC